MIDWAASDDVVVADIVADISLDVVVNLTMIRPP